MKALLNFLRELFTLTPVWVDRGGGRWAMRRRMHPLLRAVLAVSLMVFGIAWGLNRFVGEPAPETPQTAEAPAAPTEAVSPAEAPQAAEAPSLPTPMEVPALEDLMAQPVPGGKGAGTTAAPKRGQAAKAGDYWVHISKGDYTLSLYRGNELVKSYSVAVGRNPGNKQRVGDFRTPVGHFRVQSIENSQSWKHDFGDGNGMIAGAYGPWFIRLDTGWKGIGIHGTHDPDSRGSMATEGCIRMSNEEVRELRQYAYKNMRVVIEE